MKDKQREVFTNLVQKELPDLIKNKSTMIADDLKLSFQLMDIDLQDKLSDDNGTVFVPVYARCLLQNIETTESVTFSLNLLKLPVYQELGFMIRGNYMQMLDSYDKASGLHTMRKVNQSNDIDKAIIQSSNFKAIGFCRDKTKFLTELKLRGRVSDAIEISPSTFLRAITGMSKDELVAKFGYTNNFVVTIFDGRQNTLPECKHGFPVATRNDCIQATYAAIFGASAAKNADSGTISAKLTEIKKSLFNTNYFSKGEHSYQRIQYMQSFSYRATGKVLAKDVSSNNVKIKAGTVLSAQLLRELDATELPEITVIYNDAEFTLHRFARYWFGALNYTLLEDIPECKLAANTVLSLSDIDTLNSSSLASIKVKDLDGNVRTLTRDIEDDALSLDDIFTIFDIWVGNLKGLDVYDKEFDLTNRVLYPFDKRVLDIIDSDLDSVIHRVKKAYSEKGSSTNLQEYIVSYDKDIKIDAFIDQIRSSDLKLGQMSEMCNVMSFVSKDYKSTIANLKNIDDNLVTIQDHQHGRTDPFDIPESKKLASVQYRTMNSKLNESGLITVPYLKVENGAVISEEPVYLTAIEETDRYIAEWNETFLDEDGNPKQYITARYNGDIVSTDVKNISYKECSPYSGMSISHACIPFPGHSDGKRITMGCNQLSQASPMAHMERPYVNGGGESMLDYGFYRAETILEDFYKSSVAHNAELEQHKDAILSSDIELVSKHTSHGTMHLTFKILAMDEILKSVHKELGSYLSSPVKTFTFEVPYSMQTTDNTLFTYNIHAVPDNIYHPDDIICYSNSCSLKDRKHKDCLSTGIQKISEADLSKGLALTKNLRVGYKTWEGSTIDDSITISDELVFDDVLTSIFTTRIILEAKVFSDTEHEEFGLYEHEYSYFEGNGLPKLGTYLNPGDPVIAKELISKTKDTPIQKYKYLKMNQSGQVVFAGFTHKNNEEVAEVILAQRNVIEIGDKLAGRCGNKGVVAKIVPAEQMPFDPETGFRLQIILNPLGVPSRQNLSQFLDVDLSECLRQENATSTVSPYNPNDLQFVLDMKEVHNVKPSYFIDGRTGKPFKRPIHWGTISMYKLHHMVKKKYHAIGMAAPVDPVYMQPRQSSKLDGGQSFGEMEAWCLMSVNATHVLQEIYSFQSTDIAQRSHIRKEFEDGGAAPYYVSGNNSNEATMLACYRSLGVDFKTNLDEQTFEFRPLTDDLIHSFSVVPVDSVENLHNAMIFKGSSRKLEEKDQSRNRWGWIDLHMKLVHPNFICNSRILSLIRTNNSKTFNKETAELIMQGILAVGEVTSKVPMFNLYRTAKLPANNEDYADCPADVDATEDIVTGMDALVMMFQYMDTKNLEQAAKSACDGWLQRNNIEDPSEVDLSNESGYLDRLTWYHFVSTFNASETLEDYVISAFPVMPQIYRPKFANSKQTEHVDFDWHYARIISAVDALERNRNVETMYAVYDRIKSFCGLQSTPTKDEAKHKNIKTYFSGSDNENGDHGKLRTNVQSKRVFCSGRTTITPAHDTRMKPTEIGIPITMATKMYESILIGQLASISLNSRNSSRNRNDLVQALLLCSKRDKARFIKFWDSKLIGNFAYNGKQAYDAVTKLIYDVVEGRNDFPMQVILSGRQPSLHKYAIRAYLPKIVLENTVNVHTLVCSGYNADFDGDQMWLQALMSEEAKEEALRLLSPAVDYINPKDSSLILKHTQDVVLGLYCATMLKNNATHAQFSAKDVNHYQNIEQLESDLKAELINTYDLACVTVNDHRYIGTAGRIYLNYIVDGLTDEEFTNPLQIQGLKNNLYCEMAYDGIWRSGGNVKTGNLRYFKIADICMDINKKIGNDCIDKMQVLTELGFFYADKFGISLSLEDMMLKPADPCEELTDPKLIDLDNKDLTDICEQGLDKASDLKIQIEQDCYDGLISEDDKNDAIMTLYYNGTGDKDSEYMKGVHANVMDTIMDKLSKTQRNNNIFILLDSGARGKADQIMRMCGFLPQLQKDKVSSLKTPVTHNFLNGLSSFDVHMTSYSVKQGLASTQNETPQAGYATHKGVYMTSGVQIVENDCGKTNWWYDVKYSQLDDSRTTLVPSRIWFENNLLGKIVDPNDKQSLELLGLQGDNTEITDDCFATLLSNNGFHSLQLADGSLLEASVNSMVGSVLSVADKLSMMKLRNTLKDKMLTMHSVSLIQKLTMPSITTSDGTYSLWYKMDPCSKSLLLHRQCRDLKYSTHMYDPEAGRMIELTTEKTVQYIEQQNLRRVPVRILLDCRSEHGVCAHCYGLKFSSLTFPRVGDFVGTESAQAVGEPSAQLTISLVNQGGTAGAAINDGVKRFSSLLDGSVKDCALVAPRNGYVHIEPLGEAVTLSIKPIDKSCTLCNGCSFAGDCPTVSRETLPPCAFPKVVPANLLVVKEGDWVEASQPLTSLIVNPKTITAITVSEGKKSVRDTKAFEFVYRKKQTVWLENYFYTFANKGIDINARHFEIFARIQNLQGFVYYSNNPDFEQGKSYEITSLLKAPGVKFAPKLSSRPEVILNTSGAMAALSFERIQSVAASLCVDSYKSPYNYNNSLLGSVAVGTNLTTMQPKHLGVVWKRTPKPAPKRVLEAPVTYKSVDMSGDQTNEFDLDNFTFTPEVLDISNLGDEIHTIPEEPVVSPSNTNTPQAMTFESNTQNTEAEYVPSDFNSDEFNLDDEVSTDQSDLAEVQSMNLFDSDVSDSVAEIAKDTSWSLESNTEEEDLDSSLDDFDDELSDLDESVESDLEKDDVAESSDDSPVKMEF